MSLLLIYLPSPSDPASGEWPYVASEDRLTITRQGSAAAPLLPQAGRGDEVVAVVPLQALSWHRVQLPPQNRTFNRQPNRGQALLEGLLEDHLLSEPQQLHLALGPNQDCVAAVNRAWLQGALQLLENQGVTVHRIVPEVWPGMRAENGQGEPLLLAVQGPVQAEWVVVNATQVLRWPLQKNGLGDLPPDGLLQVAGQGVPGSLTVLSEPALALTAEQALHAHAEAPTQGKVGPFGKLEKGGQVTLQTAPARWLQAAQSPWNLAQHSLARSPRDRALRRLVQLGNTFMNSPDWAWARWGLVALALLQILGLNVQAWRTRHDQQELQTQMAGWLTSTFPSVQVVVDAPAQMKGELQRLRQKTGEMGPTDFESLLGAVQTSLQGTAGAQHPPREIDYSNGVLKLKGLDLNPNDFNAVAQRLRAKGLAASQQGEQLVVRSDAL